MLTITIIISSSIILSLFSWKGPYDLFEFFCCDCLSASVVRSVKRPKKETKCATIQVLLIGAKPVLQHKWHTNGQETTAKRDWYDLFGITLDLKILNFWDQNLAQSRRHMEKKIRSNPLRNPDFNCKNLILMRFFHHRICSDKSYYGLLMLTKSENRQKLRNKTTSLDLKCQSKG